jgi:maleate isomerase
MRPPGVTNHVREFRIPNAPTWTDAEFAQQLENMRATMVDAMNEVLTLEPDHVILATAADSAGGVAGAWVLRERLLAKSDRRVGVTLGADAILAALHRYGGIKRIGVVTPYMPVGDEQARWFFEDSGFATACVKGLTCGSPVLIAHAPEAAIRDAIAKMGGLEVDAVAIVRFPIWVIALPTGRRSTEASLSCIALPVYAGTVPGAIPARVGACCRWW